jgi:tight adherence protein B
MEVILPLIVFLTVLVVMVVVLRRQDYASQQQMILSRMARPTPEVDLADIDITRDERTPESNLFGNLLPRLQLIQRLEENLWQAGLYVRASDMILLMLVLGTAAGLAFAVWSGWQTFESVIVGVAVGGSPLLYVAWRKRQRLKSFDKQLPEILDLLKSSLQAGHTLQRALQVTIDEFGEPASSELRIVLEQNRLGVPLARALEYMLQRMPDENLRFLVVAVKIQSEVGSSLAGISGQLARTIRDRQRMEMKVRALTAQPRMSAMVGGLMPLLLLVALNFVAPEHNQMLFHDSTGIKLVEIAGVLEVLALITISRFTRVDY